nr:hypothetical protein [Brevundimonas diminuta]
MFDPHAIRLLREAYHQLLRGRQGAEAREVLTRVADHWRGTPPQTWVSNMFLSDAPAELASMPGAAMSRTELRAYLKANPNPHRALAAILAWGGTGYRAREGVSSTWQNWVTTFDFLRGKPAETQYAHYLAATGNRTLKGLGPAFFTKAVFFTADRDAPGYILDQWTARSANALTNDRTFVRLTSQKKEVQPDGVFRPAGFIVSSANDATRYSRFNRLVADLAENLDCSPEHAELLMFSKATWWRAYLVQRANENRALEGAE